MTIDEFLRKHADYMAETREPPLPQLEDTSKPLGPIAKSILVGAGLGVILCGVLTILHIPA